MAAGRSVTLGEGTRYRRDESSLPPTGHPISFRRRLPYDWKEMDVGPFLRSPLGSASGRLCFWPYDSCRRSTFGGSVPYIDGLRETYLQNNVNGILRSRAEALQKKAGEGARLSYEITLNRPSLVSFVLKAEGQRTVYDGVTIDTEAGSVLDEKDLLYTKSADYERLLDGKHYVFGETGILAESTDGAPLRT